MTPALILDRAKVARNAERMSDRMRRMGVRLRPHVKTAKSAAVARYQTEGWASGITVSTLAEADYFARHGHRDITYAVSIVPGKLAQAETLIREGVALSVVTDHPAMAKALVEHAAQSSVSAPLPGCCNDSGRSGAGRRAGCSRRHPTPSSWPGRWERLRAVEGWRCSPREGTRARTHSERNRAS